MACCTCYCITKDELSCGHCFCKACAIKYIDTRWKSGRIKIACPMCRKNLELSCRISDGESIFKYDNDIYFRISSLGNLENLPEGWQDRLWERARTPPHRLQRSVSAFVRPILQVESHQDKRELESRR